MKKEVRNMLIMLGIGVVVVVLGITYLTSTYAGPPTEEGLRVSLAESKAAFDSGEFKSHQLIAQKCHESVNWARKLNFQIAPAHAFGKWHGRNHPRQNGF